MKRYLISAIILLTTFAAEANKNSFVQSTSKEHYQECLAVSLYTMQGKELNSIVKNNRTIEDTNTIPEGWTVVGVTTKKEDTISAPYLVICH